MAAVPIFNIDQGQNADLIFGNQNGPISGFAPNPGANQQWTVTNAGINQFTIWNLASGAFASVVGPQVNGRGIEGDAAAFVWNNIFIAPGQTQIASPGNAFVWALEDNANFFQILLRPINLVAGVPQPFAGAQWVI